MGRGQGARTACSCQHGTRAEMGPEPGPIEGYGLGADPWSRAKAVDSSTAVHSRSSMGTARVDRTAAGPVRTSRSSISWASRTALRTRRRRSTAAAWGERRGGVDPSRVKRVVSDIWHVLARAPSVGAPSERRGVPEPNARGAVTSATSTPRPRGRHLVVYAQTGMLARPGLDILAHPVWRQGPGRGRVGQVARDMRRGSPTGCPPSRPSWSGSRWTSLSRRRHHPRWPPRTPRRRFRSS
jgi:hypothetical protein